MNVKKILLKTLKVMTILAIIALVCYGLVMWLIYAAMKAKPGPWVVHYSHSVRESLDSNFFIALFKPIADRDNADFVSDSLQIESLLFEWHPDTLHTNPRIALVVMPKCTEETDRCSYEIDTEGLPWSSKYPTEIYIFRIIPDTCHRDTISFLFRKVYFQEGVGSPNVDYDYPPVRVKFERIRDVDAYLKEESLRMSSE